MDLHDLHLRLLAILAVVRGIALLVLAACRRSSGTGTGTCLVGRRGIGVGTVRTVIATDRYGTVGISPCAATTNLASRREQGADKDNAKAKSNAKAKDDAKAATNSLAGQRSTKGRDEDLEGRDEGLQDQEGCLEAEGREGRDEGLEEREDCLEAEGREGRDEGLEEREDCLEAEGREGRDDEDNGS